MSGEPNAYRIEAEISRGAIASVHITQPHAIDVVKLVVGRPAQTVPGMLAQLLAVCSEAQRNASLGALEMKLADDAERRRRARAVLQERLINGLWRLAIDWPRALVRPEMPQLIVAARRAIAVGLDLNTIVDKAANTALAEAMVDVAEAAPDLRGRIAAALNDPREVLEALTALDGGALDPVWAGDGGVVMTSRGPLTHHASVVDGVVTAYAIAAPTDAVMAPGGDMERALVGLAGADLARKALARIALIDPCAPVDFRFARPAHA